ncbi:glutaredoxin family protein [Singulisphaera sp. PoT]|uniref:glutaredoxin family protein n=1 Tax=Singulisphaera sp. PoT TaxID=3411797 RepID=UPI003BF60A62
MLEILSRWARPRVEARPLKVTVYSREDCGCCHKALATLSQHQGRFNLVVDIVNVDADPALVELYGRTVPVVSIEGKVRFKGLVNPILLGRILEAESKAIPQNKT